MTKPIKKAGFMQGIYEQSATRKEEIGTLRILKDGRKFRYSRAGSSALAVGKLCVAAAVGADVMNEACASAHAIGDTIIQETMTSGTYAEDYFAGGYFQVNDATGEGQSYKILSSSAVTASTTIIITLEDPLKVALVASTSEYSLIHHPNMAVVQSTTAACPVGYPSIAVTGSYYFWCQTAGLVAALMVGTPAVGFPVHQSTTTAGGVSGDDYASYYPWVGIVHGTVGVSTEYKPVMVNLD